MTAHRIARVRDIGDRASDGVGVRLDTKTVVRVNDLVVPDSAEFVSFELGDGDRPLGMSAEMPAAL